MGIRAREHRQAFSILLPSHKGEETSYLICWERNGNSSLSASERRVAVGKILDLRLLEELSRQER
jgi:hypothetical protein